MKGQTIFRVKKAGVYTTFQDLGRSGYQRFGVPVSGAMDTFALQIANILVGNQRSEACIEATLIGPELEVKCSIAVAITGANIQPQVNGKSIPMWQSIRLEPGDILHFGKLQTGVRAYISLAGGYDFPEMLGSKSTDVNSGFGRLIEKEDTICGHPACNRKKIGLSKQLIPTYDKSIDAAMIEGPHQANFTEEARNMFFSTSFTVDANSNRMGYRLKSETCGIQTSGQVWSDAIPFGGIQIPQNGQPIILMADRQTTGGYPRIGTVISNDLGKVAQLPPQGEIKFHTISVDEAQKQAAEREMFLYCLETFRKGIN
ncbi:biotin-dependent carboxyltransferase family protein [Virgibacillus oceani]|uniref:KipI antagonist n=1 Tax=Virgibacillus oceani TaxID=1479511 RepID=A0A917LZY9_9BACI|nr:biotin-dependent carboxyltransferase family protein [Virgibacillus oceani]GGG67614.1 KipI antagonist [Virgibacillus oceani]